MFCMYFKRTIIMCHLNNKEFYFILLKQANLSVFVPLSHGFLGEANSYLYTSIYLPFCKGIKIHAHFVSICTFLTEKLRK